MPRTKVDHFISLLNIDKECDFFKRFSLQMTSIQLDTLLMALETAVEILSSFQGLCRLLARTSTQQVKKSGPLNVINL